LVVNQEYLEIESQHIYLTQLAGKYEQIPLYFNGDDEALIKALIQDLESLIYKFLYTKNHLIERKDLIIERLFGIATDLILKDGISFIAKNTLDRKIKRLRCSTI
jgi:hypothetical protein